MNEIVNKVFESEDQARKLLDDTRNEISVLQRNLDKDIENINIGAQEKASAALQALVNQERVEAAELRRKALENARKKDEIFYIQMESKISAVTGKIVDFIAAPEYVREEF
ncbi:MAG: hypothetical protein PF518_16675 [Spirochaetaceae bacterium]|jgi:phage gp46-like protein|nr:hypothetical protein [Spirochaetaceae bacterium]